MKNGVSLFAVHSLPENDIRIINCVRCLNLKDQVIVEKKFGMSFDGYDVKELTDEEQKRYTEVISQLLFRGINILKTARYGTPDYEKKLKEINKLFYEENKAENNKVKGNDDSKKTEEVKSVEATKIEIIAEPEVVPEEKVSGKDKKPKRKDTRNLMLYLNNVYTKEELVSALSHINEERAQMFYRYWGPELDGNNVDESLTEKEIFETRLYGLRSLSAYLMRENKERAIAAGFKPREKKKKPEPKKEEPIVNLTTPDSEVCNDVVEESNISIPIIEDISLPSNPEVKESLETTESKEPPLILNVPNIPVKDNKGFDKKDYLLIKNIFNSPKFKELLFSSVPLEEAIVIALIHIGYNGHTFSIKEVADFLKTTPEDIKDRALIGIDYCRSLAIKGFENYENNLKLQYQRKFIKESGDNSDSI